jgi:predicted acyltransferase
MAVLTAIAAVLLVGYWGLMRFVPVPGYGVPTHGVGMLDPDGNLAAWMDRGVNAWTQRWLHTGSLYNTTRDPEGLLSTLPAIATTLLGCVTGLVLTDERLMERAKLRLFAACGVGGLLTGLTWGTSFPINKNLWTSSYVLFSAGWSLLLLAVCFWAVDMRRLNETRVGRLMVWPWLVFGSNAIFAFCFSNLVVEILLWIKVPAGGGGRVSAWLWVYLHGFARGGSTDGTSLEFALAFVALCFVPNFLLWRRKIFVKV